MSWIRIVPPVLVLSPILVLGASVTPATPEEIDLLDDIVTAGQRPDEPTTEEIAVEQRVPDLGGMDLTRAENALAAAGFALGRVSRQPSTGAIGTVIDHSPAAGALATPRSTVDLTLALPIGPFAMPDLRGLGVEQAQEHLADHGLGPVRIKQVKRRTQSGSVVTGQTPRPGKKVVAGKAVELLVAVPRLVDDPLAKVPNLVGRSLRALQRTRGRGSLGSLGLALGDVIYVEDSRHTNGAVVRQSPAAGSRVRRGTRVNVWVARHVEPRQPQVRVPALMCMPTQNALHVLLQAGLRYSASGQGPHVVRQSPAAGARVSRGSVVRIYLNSCPR